MAELHHNAQGIARLGINYIANVVTKMGYIWRESSSQDVGFHGEIEIVIDNQATAQFIKVHLKSGRSYFKNNTTESFNYYLDTKHLLYFQRSSTPVILVLYDPESDIAYWMDIKTYIHNSTFNINTSLSYKIKFNKLTNHFSTQSAKDLMSLFDPDNSSKQENKGSSLKNEEQTQAVIPDSAEANANMSSPSVQTSSIPDSDVSDNKSRLTGFSADVYTDKDLLGIEGDVEAFAQLIAARSIDPPLSIGLFGDWGSGKTFFMRYLRKRVEEIARESEVSLEAQKDIAFYKRIVQIECNAWHYSEGNLWASLVEHIFQNLRVNKDDDEKTVKERQEALLKKLEMENAAQLHALAKEKEAEEKLEQKERELQAVEMQLDEERKQLGQVSGRDIISSVKASLEFAPAVKGQINEALKATGFEAVGEAAGDFQDALSQASAVLNRGGNIVLSLTRAQNKNKRFFMLIVILLAAPIIGILVRWLTQQFDLSAFYASFSAIAALLTTGVVWIRKQANWASHWIAKIERAKQEVDKKIEADIAAKKAEQEKEIATHRQELELLRTKYNALRREREEAQRRVDEIREEIRQSTAAQLLGKFIQDRASSDDYRKHLGLLALIRRDFEEISNLLDEDNTKLLEMDWNQEQTDKTNRINRIVLYIDDLDRCQPSQVVAVLQAVHLLLAFKLFIVVVGVDCRWVTQSLRKYYPELLRDTLPVKEKVADSDKKSEEKVTNFQTATSRDYLEKIFQIPFWLNPMTPTSTVSLLKGMLESSVVKDDFVQNAQAAVEENTSDIGVGSEPNRQQTVKIEERKPASQTVGLVKFDLNPKSLDLRERELKFMESLAPLLGRSPRSVKRFVNIYRLIKVSLSLEDQAEFLEEDIIISQYKVVMFLLVIETGLPSISTNILNMLLDDLEFSGNAPRLFKGILETLGNDPSKEEEVTRINTWLVDNGVKYWGKMEISRFSKWAPLISRFSFNTERT
jgi:hypothetical protein